MEKIQVFLGCLGVCLYLWLVATGRTVLRLRSREEMAGELPTKLMWISGIVLIASAVMVFVGEAGVQALAFGEPNRFSEATNVMVPTLIIVGIFDLILGIKSVCKSGCTRILTLAALIANVIGVGAGVGVAGVTSLIFHRVRFYRYDNLPFAAFSKIDDFPGRWLEAYGRYEAIPLLRGFAPYNALRMIPCNMAFFLGVLCSWRLFLSLVAFTAREETDDTTKTASPPISLKERIPSVLTSILGLLVLATSVLLSWYLSNVTTTFYLMKHDMFVCLLAVVLAALSVVSIWHGPRSSGWHKLLVLALAGGGFVLAYNCFGTVDDMSGAPEAYSKAVMGSDCKEMTKSSYRNSNYWNGNVRTTTTSKPLMKDQACFRRASSSLITCLPRWKICDGKVDIEEPVNVCIKNSNVGDYYISIFSDYDSQPYIDELFCPSFAEDAAGFNYASVRGVWALLWAALVLCPAVVASVGLGTWRKADGKGRRSRERLVCLLDRMREALNRRRLLKRAMGDQVEREDEAPIIRNGAGGGEGGEENPC